MACPLPLLPGMMGEAEGNVKQCAVLVVNCSGRENAHSQALLRRGFRVVEMAQWPSDDVVTQYEVVVIVLREIDIISVVAARMRAKPRFGNRVLIGVTRMSPGLRAARDRRPIDQSVLIYATRSRSDCSSCTILLSEAICVP